MKFAPIARLILAASLLALPCIMASSFDHDTASDCDTRTKDCVKDLNTFLQCPITCAKALEPSAESRASSGTIDDEAFYQLQATDMNGKTIDFENYEGYVTVIAALPKQQGEDYKWIVVVQCYNAIHVSQNVFDVGFKAVAQFYYEMLQHLHDIYPYTLEILIVPLEKKTEIQPHKHAKVRLLKDPHPQVLSLLQSRLHGNLAYQDKATLYLVSADGNTVEAFVSTTMPDFQRYLRYHFQRDLRESEF